jgi:SAM-dependent methyltransferase
MWGESEESFYSGPGSDNEYAEPYARMLATELADRAAEEELQIVDLGCGDFRVGSLLLRALPSVRYVGVDVVPELINYHQATHGGERVRFMLADIIEHPLPTGHICLMRQVLQHLSNAQITRILDKLSGFDVVYITEHYPNSQSTFEPNLDKPPGADVRLLRNSAVCIDAPPFNVTGCRLVLCMDNTGWGGGEFRTYRFYPRRE